MSTLTPFCNDYWYHGYQGLGITYTNSATNSDGFFAIGGSVPSGCNSMQSKTYLNDQCAIVEAFESYKQEYPTKSYLLNLFPYSSTVNLGIVGISALAVD